MNPRSTRISRRLLERCPTDDAVAFVLAHEAAHHDCGHLALFAGWAEWVPRSLAGGYVAALLVKLQHFTYGPEREAEADLRAIELCAATGYRGDLCAQLLEILENYALDMGDYDGVFGPENLLDPTDPGRGSVSYQLQRWLWTRARGYLPLRERRDRVRAWLRARGG
ncbi:MAG TPA: M48 family metalloprotease [Gemmatimonadaceae bacterium]|nr:M48 family metalloprotease [Gemmatimonadaceae bacterium]